MITAAQMHAIFPDCTDPATWAEAIAAAWARWGITSRNAQAGYLGICGNESGGFTHTTREDTRWSANQILHYFPRLGLSLAGAEELARTSAEHRANVVYAGVLGNGDAASGDGWRFRGNGIPQLTGRANHRACSNALDVDLIADPDALSRDPVVSAAAAAWFMAAYEPKILPLLDSDSEVDFLKGAKMVGSPPNAEATARRLAYRARALTVLAAARPSGDPPPIDRAVIRRIQAALNRAGVAPKLAEDGIWGPKTQVAAAAYRVAHGLDDNDGPTIDLAHDLGVVS